MQACSLLLAILLVVNCVCGLPTPFSKHSLLKREGNVQICDLPVKTGSYAKKCKNKTGYVYSDPNPQNVDGSLDMTAGNWQGNKGSPRNSRGFECDHLVEAQWLRSRIVEKFATEDELTKSPLCKTVRSDRALKLHNALNGPLNMIGVPTGVNQLKNHVTREPGWEKWIKTKYSPYNFNKARGGLVSYLTDNRQTATDVATQLYEVFSGYDPVKLPASGKQSWATQLGLEYDKSIGVLSSKKLIDEIYGICEANGSTNPQGKRPPELDAKDAEPKKKAKTIPAQPRSLWHSTLSWTRAIVTGKPMASAASKPESTDGVDYECVRKGYTPDAKLSSSMLSSSTSSAARSTSLTRTADLTSTDSLSSASSLTSGSSSTRTQQRPSATQRTASASEAEEALPTSLHAVATAKAALRPSSAPFYASSDVHESLHSGSRSALQPLGPLPSSTRQPGLIRPTGLASAPPPAALLPRPSSGTLAPRPASNTPLRPAAAMPTRRPILPASSKPPTGGRKAGRIHL